MNNTAKRVRSQYTDQVMQVKGESWQVHFKSISERYVNSVNNVVDYAAIHIDSKN